MNTVPMTLLTIAAILVASLIIVACLQHSVAQTHCVGHIPFRKACKRSADANATSARPNTRAPIALLLIAAFSMFSAGRANATLIDIGNGMVYDSVLDITWLQDANAHGGVFTDWYEMTSWASTLIVNGISGWRLPYASVSAGAGPVSSAG